MVVTSLLNSIGTEYPFEGEDQCHGPESIDTNKRVSKASERWGKTSKDQAP
jgi:hypothetical protein